MRAILLAPLLVGCATLGIGDDGLDSDKGDTKTEGRWEKVIDFQIVAAHAHLLPTGEVMYWDRGNTGGGITKTTPWGPPRIWNPDTGNIETITSTLDYEPFCSGHAMLADGRLFVAGGHDGADTLGDNRASIFDPASRTWTTVAERMSLGRWYPTATPLAGGDILILSGSAAVGQDGLIWNDLPQIYMQRQGRWRNLTGARFGIGGGIDPRITWFYPFMHLAPDGRVFMAGPAQETGYLDTVNEGQWSMAGAAARPFSTRSAEPFRDYGSTVQYAPGKIMIVGGSGTPGARADQPPTASAEIIDLNDPNPRWRSAGTMAHARRMHTATVLPDGTVLVSGGTSGPGFNDAGGSVMQPELWDPATNQWTELAPMDERRIYHSIALLLPDARVLVAGGGLPVGGNVPDTDHTTAQVYSPPYLFRGRRPDIAQAPKEINYGTRFAVTTTQADRIERVTLVRLGSVTHAFNHNQRFLELAFTRNGDNLDIEVPANRNIAPPGHYMLFVLNDDGVPSVARIVQVVPQFCDVAVTVRGVDFTAFGQSVMLTGSLPELGEFNPRFGAQLDGNQFPTWTGTVRVPRGMSFDYKAAIFDPGTDTVQFETGGNRLANTADAASCPPAIDLDYRR